MEEKFIKYLDWLEKTNPPTILASKDIYYQNFLVVKKGFYHLDTTPLMLHRINILFEEMKNSNKDFLTKYID
ncbi:hypothetical protein, partial [Cetobacterium sp.]|uniref:hypothetical protein n=1 Tax=Cetobacterium sp. TaxID=2071632 RepID=UPI003F2E7739